MLLGHRFLLRNIVNRLLFISPRKKWFVRPLNINVVFSHSVRYLSIWLVYFWLVRSLCLSINWRNVRRFCRIIRGFFGVDFGVDLSHICVAQLSTSEMFNICVIPNKFFVDQPSTCQIFVWFTVDLSDIRVNNCRLFRYSCQ